MVGILVVGFLANLAVRPVADRFHEPSSSVSGDGTDETEEEPAQPEAAQQDSAPSGANRTDTAIRASRSTPLALVIAGWTLVGVPLFYGLGQTLTDAVSLFG